MPVARGTVAADNLRLVRFGLGAPVSYWLLTGVLQTVTSFVRTVGMGLCREACLSGRLDKDSLPKP